MELLAELELGKNQQAHNLAALPTREGGLGVPLFTEMAADIYRAAYAALLKVVKRIRPLSPQEEVLVAKAIVSLSAK